MVIVYDKKSILEGVNFFSFFSLGETHWEERWMDPGGRVLFSRGKCTLLNLYGIWYMVATLIVPSAEGDGDVCGDGDGQDDGGR